MRTAQNGFTREECESLVDPISAFIESVRTRDGVIDLLNRFIEFQAFGGLINEGQEIKCTRFLRE